MKRNDHELIICVACLAVLALVCMSMVPFVEAAAAAGSSPDSSGTAREEPTAHAVHTHTTSTGSRHHSHCKKKQSEMCDRLAGTLEDHDGQRFANLADACLRTADECTDCCVQTVQQQKQDLTVASFATNRFKVPTTPCAEMMRHTPSSASVAPSDAAAAGRCNFPLIPGCEGIMFWKRIVTKTIRSDGFASNDRDPDMPTTSTDLLIHKVSAKMKNALTSRKLLRTDIEFDAFEGPLPGETDDKQSFSLSVTVEKGSGSDGSNPLRAHVAGKVEMLEKRQCCGGNQILALVECIFRELNVPYVDLLDASRANCPLFTPAVAAEVCTMDELDPTALGQACNLLTRRVHRYLLPLSFSYAVTNDHYYSWYESKGYTMIGDQEPYIEGKKAFFEVPFADFDALTRCYSWINHEGRTENNFQENAVAWHFDSHAVSEIDSLFGSRTVAPAAGDTVHAAFRKAYAKIAHEFTTDKAAAVKHCAALGVYVRTFWGQNIYKYHKLTPDGPWCTEANLRHLASVNLRSEGHLNARDFIYNYAEGQMLRKFLRVPVPVVTTLEPARD